MASRKSFAEILRSVCTERGWEFLPSGVNVQHADGRHQVIQFELFELEGRGMVRLISVIGDAGNLSPGQMEQALRANMNLAHGALALKDAELCMTDTLSLEESEAGEVDSAVAFIAKLADTYEKLLFGTDQY